MRLVILFCMDLTPYVVSSTHMPLPCFQPLLHESNYIYYVPHPHPACCSIPQHTASPCSSYVLSRDAVLSREPDHTGCTSRYLIRLLFYKFKAQVLYALSIRGSKQCTCPVVLCRSYRDRITAAGRIHRDVCDVVSISYNTEFQQAHHPRRAL